MNLDTFYETWNWLLNLSKVQLILLGGGVALLVAVSKFLRFVFLIAVLLLFLIVFLPQLLKSYEQSPLPGVVDDVIQRGVEATQDPPSPPPGQDAIQKGP